MKSCCSWCEEETENLEKYEDISGKTVLLCEECRDYIVYCPECDRVGHSDYSDEDFVFEKETETIICIHCYAKQYGVKRVWHQTDRWRGHYAFEPIDNKHYIAVECCLVPHPDNDRIIQIVTNFLDLHGFKTKILTGLTSNVFSRNLIIVAWKDRKDRKLTKKEKRFLADIDNLFVDYYTRGFSILTGKIYPIDLEAFKKDLRRLTRKTL